jgi:hypothetical protein
MNDNQEPVLICKDLCNRRNGDHAVHGRQRRHQERQYYV